MIKKSLVFAVLMCVAVLGAAELAQAQQTATEIVTIRATGVLMGRSGETIIVDVKEGQHLGMRKFAWKDLENVKFYNRLGQEVQPHQITIGSTMTVEYTEAHEVPVVVTMTEVRQMDEVHEVAAAPAPAPAPAAPAPAPAAMPSTASSLPLILLVGLMILTVAVTLTIVRRS